LSDSAPESATADDRAAEPDMAVVIVTHNSARHVRATLEALAGELRQKDELVIVDNASEDGTPATVRAHAPRARVLEQRRNIGFAAGCNVGVSASSAPLLMFLNPDAVPASGCLDALRRAADALPGWGAWQALVTLPGRDAINTCGGVVHFLGVGWAGLCGEPLSRAPDRPVEVGFASGAALVVRRTAWNLLGGFDDRYFMYGEDLDLALRLRLNGLGVGIVPGARVEHDYDFAKGERKWFLLERNRWWTILSVYPWPLLILLAPALAANELALVGVAIRGRWLRAKLQANACILRDLPLIRRRRREVQLTRAIGGARFAEVLSSRADSPFLGALARQPVLLAAQRGYWQVVRRLLSGLPCS
jgi:GT2 family glycosyltransferase